MDDQKWCCKTLFTLVRYRTVPLRFVPNSFQKVVLRGLRSHGYEKKLSGLFQNRSRNWALRKSEPEIETTRYRTVPFSCGQKRYDIVPFSGPSLVSTGDTKLVFMTTTDVEVEIRLKADDYSRFFFILFFKRSK